MMLINMLGGLEDLPSLLIYKYEYISANYHKTLPGQCEVCCAHRMPSPIGHRTLQNTVVGGRSRTGHLWRIIGVVTTPQAGPFCTRAPQVEPHRSEFRRA